MENDIHGCKWHFKFQCPMQWGQLPETSDPRVKTCGVCLEKVFLCESDDEVAHHAESGHCVAIFLPRQSTIETEDVGEQEFMGLLMDEGDASR